MSERKPAPPIDHPYVFSVSQVETFLLCPRKWAYLKIDGLEDPGNASSKLGGEVHDVLEDYLAKAIPINVRKQAGRIAMAGVPHLPPPKYPGMEIEEWFSIRIGNFQGKHGVGAYYRGLKDVQIRGGWISHRPFVSDHKTTKDFMWAKSAEALTGGASGVGDIQAGLYAYELMESEGVDEVDLQWTYMRTTGAPVANPTITTITREQAERVIRKLERVTEEMIRAKDAHTSALTVVQDFNGCDAFGGCKRIELCKPSPRDKLKAMFSQEKKEEEKMASKKSGVLGRLAERKAAKNGGAPAATKETKTEKAAAKEEKTKETEATDAAVNPPENAESPVVTEAQAANRGKGKSSSTKTSTKSSAPTATGVAPAGVFSRAVDAFCDVFLDEIAKRVSDRIQK